MSYQALARKWRPQTFQELVGQDHIVKTLTHALDNDRLHHAYLFTGTRGVGKTTLGRIFAKCLNCETNGVSSNPCGECPSCIEITEGRFIDLLEIDAASKTKVDDTREMLDNVQYMPSRGRYKVYLIDEVHMLTTQSFNALLKTLEEPPEHVKFLLATTDPQKIPATVLSRCLQFQLKNMLPEKIVTHLKHVLSADHISFEEAGLWQLAQGANGSMRDALSLTDQAIAFSGGKITEQAICDMLGTASQGVALDFLSLLHEDNGAQILQMTQTMAEVATDFSGVLEQLLFTLHQCAVLQVLPEAADVLDQGNNNLATLAEKLSAEDVQLWYQMALKGREEIQVVANERVAFEMILLRMLAFKIEQAPEQSIGAPPAKKFKAVSVTTLADVQEKDISAALQPSSHSDKRKNSTQSVQARGVIEPAVTAKKEGDSKAKSTQVETQFKPIKTPVENGSTPGTESHNVPLSAYNDSFDTAFDNKENVTSRFAVLGKQAAKQLPDWHQVVEELSADGLLLALAECCCVSFQQGENIALILDRSYAGVYKDAHGKQLNQLLNNKYQRNFSLTVTIGEPIHETPWQRKIRKDKERIQQAITTLQQDPVVQTIGKNFNGVLEQDTVVPFEKITQST